MSLKSSFKLNVSAQTEGVWLSYPANTDKTIPRFRLARMNINNPRYAAALERVKANLIAGSTKTDDEDRIGGVKLLVDGCLLEWEHFQPDDDGKELEYSRANAVAELSKPEWADLVNDFALKASARTNFLAADNEARAKN